MDVHAQESDDGARTFDGIAVHSVQVHISSFASEAHNMLKVVGDASVHQEITLVYICRIRMRLYVIKTLNDIHMSNNF